MGHDHHFLARLDRVKLPDAERALALYRDHELVREILERSSAPPDAERIAISLGDPESGPFVIVARSGHFVTCLGEGMFTELPVVTRAELDLVTAHCESARVAVRCAADHDRILRAVFDHGETLVRDDIAELRVVQPLVESVAARRLLDLPRILMEAQSTARRLVKRKGRASQRWVTDYYRLCWLYRNNMIVLGMGSPRLPRFIIQEQGNAYSLTYPALALEVSFLTLTAAWFIATVGPPALEGYWHRVHDEDYVRCLDSLISPTAIAVRNPECLSDVLAKLEEISADHEYETIRLVAEGAIELLNKEAEGTLSPILIDAYRERFFPALHDVWPELEAPDQIELDLVYPLIFEAPFNPIATGVEMLDALSAAILLARVDAETLCPPPTLAVLGQLRSNPALAVPSLRRTLRASNDVRYQPKTAPKVPNRNSPCSCGSGKKYKRCCGA